MLKLTKKADYSLIALKHFAAVRLSDGSGAAALSAKELADSSGIPLPLLSKLLQKLGKSGFLISEYGTNGGYRLAREPRDISALQVIRAIDGPIVLANCFTSATACGHSDRCTIKKPLPLFADKPPSLLNKMCNGRALIGIFAFTGKR